MLVPFCDPIIVNQTINCPSTKKINARWMPGRPRYGFDVMNECMKCLGLEATDDDLFQWLERTNNMPRRTHKHIPHVGHIFSCV